MPRSFNIIWDSLSENDIPADINFLNWRISKLHLDAFTLGFSFDDDKHSKNHWAIILETSGRWLRLSMESLHNDRTGKLSVLVLKRLSYDGISINVLFHDSFTWTGPNKTVKEFLDFVISQGWHKFEMHTNPDLALKGCRHHVQTVTNGIQEMRWINEKSDEGRKMEDYLPFVYTKDREGYLEKTPKDIERGRFLQ